MNIHCITGRIINEPELRVTDKGTNVISFGVSVKRDFSKDTDIFDCVAWRKKAEFISQYFHKGNMIAITGEGQKEKYTDRNGVEKTTYKIVVNTADFCTSKSDDNNEENKQPIAIEYDEGDLPW